jgi:DNA-binding MarR family transcriptional regulator
MMFANVSGAAIAARFASLADRFGGSTAADRAEQGQRKLMAAIASRQPATLNEVADAIGRGAPAVSRAVETLVRAGLVERTHDPDNRRRLALRLSQQGEDTLRARPAAHGKLTTSLDRLAQSELRAIERAIEILERLPG